MGGGKLRTSTFNLWPAQGPDQLLSATASDIQLKNPTLYQTYEPHFSKRNASFFTATPYAYHRFLDYCCAQLFSRRKRSKNKTSPKISEEHLEISLRMTSTQTDSCISFTKSHISQVLWLCWPPFHVLTKKY